ncbi:MAG TPA: isochorismatase family cysteine hydrolase [Thermoanaerobaculia bacterium]|nr:isochorismatase family cysteine hydrolase [Thermoanaerobaculia bacterium]
MPAKNPDLHGNVPDSCEVALLLIDVINDLEFDTGPELFSHALPMARSLASFKKRLKDAGIPVVYINDNFGKWQSDLRKLVDHCLEDDVRGKPLVELLRPEDDDYFVLKPKHSGFYSTTLDTLLTYLGARRLILTGVATNVCVQFTANDAYLRDFHLVIPRDCVAAANPEDTHHALEQMRVVLKADVRASTEIATEELTRPVADETKAKS